MSWLREAAVMLGSAPRKPLQRSDAADIAHGRKRGRGAHTAQLIEAAHSAPQSRVWLRRRWAFLIGVNLLFVASFQLDIQVLEGSLTASRLLGFHLADVYSALLISLAERHVPVNLAIGAITVAGIWALFGGRAYCSWVCPYHAVAELAERLHRWLADRGVVRDHALHRGVRSVFWLLFLALALLTGQALFLTLNPIGILSRAMVYGPTLALGWVLLLLAFEVIYSRRAWCRYVCPIGLTLGVVGVRSPVVVAYNLETCAHEGDCRKVCEVPHVLDLTIKGRAEDTQLDIGPDCTRCGMCVDVCPTDSLGFRVKGLDQLL